MTILTIVLLSTGFLFISAGVIGVLRFPDFYTRLHAMSKCDALGIFLMATGMAIHAGMSLNAIKIFLIAIFVAGASSTATHALGRAAFRSGLAPWKREDS